MHVDQLTAGATWPATLLARHVMTGRVVHCDPDTPRDHVARLMAQERIHSVVVTGLDAPGRPSWGVVSDVDLVTAGLAGEDVTAGALARTEALTVASTDRAVDVARVLLDHEVAHAIVVRDARPVGVVSTLDLVRTLPR